MKKILYLFLVFGGVAYLGYKIDFSRLQSTECPFCDKKNLETQVFYRESGVLGFITYKPAVPGHVLIIPERHVERFEELSAEEIAAIGDVIKKVDVAVRTIYKNADYFLLQKNGKKAGQSVPHVHFHYVPGAKWLPVHFFAAPWLKPISSEEIKLLKEILSEAISASVSIPANPV